MSPKKRGNTDISILYVDDDTDTRNILENVVSNTISGVKLHFANNGKSGLESFKKLNPQIVITDINMPVMDGIQMSKKIKEVNPETVIIAVSAYNDAQYLLNAIEIGIDNYILKPVDLQKLITLIKKFIDEINLAQQVKDQEKEIQRLSSFPQFSPNPILELDEDGKVTFCNMDLCSEGGLPFIPKNLPDILREMQENNTNQHELEIEINGEIYTELIHNVPKFNSIRIYATNITKRKKAEIELQKAHDELELRVAERTGELTQKIDDLEKAEELLKCSFREIKELKDRLKAENIYLQQEVAQQFNFGEIIGQSSAMSYVFFRVEQVAPMNATVLLLGETGTGKGVVARAIHSRSSRKNRAMVTVNCSSLPANLIESELFGRERGAFTGSDARQIGRFELADGGTIFLDEISEMPMELQPKLLRVIQDGEFERLGSPKTIKVDVRIIAASNRNLETEIRNGKFREDLFYRLNVFPITIPPLSQRQEDISLLVSHFVDKFNKKTGRKITTVPKDTLKAFEEYHWPGNVRELESVIERAVIISQGTTLQVLDRFESVRKPEEPQGHEVKAMSELERDHIIQILKKTKWRIEGNNGAAALLGLNASTLRARMRKLGIVRQ